MIKFIMTTKHSLYIGWLKSKLYWEVVFKFHQEPSWGDNSINCGWVVTSWNITLIRVVIIYSNHGVSASLHTLLWFTYNIYTEHDQTALFYWQGRHSTTIANCKYHHLLQVHQPTKSNNFYVLLTVSYFKKSGL